MMLLLLYVKVNASRIHFSYKNKDDAIRIINNYNLLNKKGVFIFFSLHIKMSGLTYYKKNGHVIE